MCRRKDIFVCWKHFWHDRLFKIRRIQFSQVFHLQFLFGTVWVQKGDLQLPNCLNHCIPRLLFQIHNTKTKKALDWVIHRAEFECGSSNARRKGAIGHVGNPDAIIIPNPERESDIQDFIGSHINVGCILGGVIRIVRLIIFELQPKKVLQEEPRMG